MGSCSRTPCKSGSLLGTRHGIRDREPLLPKASQGATPGRLRHGGRRRRASARRPAIPRDHGSPTACRLHRDDRFESSGRDPGGFPHRRALPCKGRQWRRRRRDASGCGSLRSQDDSHPERPCAGARQSRPRTEDPGRSSPRRKAGLADCSRVPWLGQGGAFDLQRGPSPSAHGTPPCPPRREDA